MKPAWVLTLAKGFAFEASSRLRAAVPPLMTLTEPVCPFWKLPVKVVPLAPTMTKVPALAAELVMSPAEPAREPTLTMPPLRSIEPASFRTRLTEAGWAEPLPNWTAPDWTVMLPLKERRSPAKRTVPAPNLVRPRATMAPERVGTPLA